MFNSTSKTIDAKDGSLGVELAKKPESPRRSHDSLTFGLGSTRRRLVGSINVLVKPQFNMPYFSL